MQRLLMFFWVSVCSAATFFVSPQGDDAHNGSAAEPWSHPGWASRQMSGGDTLILRSGEYILQDFGTDMLTPPAGTQDHWTVVRGENGAVLAGAENLYALVILDGAAFVCLENLELTHHANAYSRDGITAVGSPNENLLFRNLHIHHLDQFGINIRDVDGLRVENCIIEYCGFGAIGGPEAGNGGGWRNISIDHSSLSYSGHYYQNGEAENPYARPDGFGNEASPGPITVSHCRIEHNKGDGLDCKSKSLQVLHCTIANNRTDGLKLWGNNAYIENTLIYGRGDGDATPTPWAAVVIDSPDSNAVFQFVNCTIDDELGENYFFYAQYDMPQIPVQIDLQNCILSSRGARASLWLPENSDISLSHCLFWLPQNEYVVQHGDFSISAQNLAQVGEYNLYGDPLFNFTGWGSDGDYQLQSNSPAIDAGADVGGNIDLAGQARLSGAAMDIGAFEFQYPVTVQHRYEQALHDVHLFPNPANPRLQLLFSLPSPQFVDVAIYNCRGQLIEQLAKNYLPAGSHQFYWDGEAFASGVYFCRMNAQVFKFSLLK